MIEHLTISRIGQRGDGIVDTAAGAVFVPCALPGEMVEVDAVKGHPDRRQLLRVETPSPERIEPVCPHFGICGGCQTQHWDFARYRAWKHGLVVEALRQAGLDAPVDELIDAHGKGRRRATFHARRSQMDVLAVGFAAFRAHEIIAIDQCPVLAPQLAGAIRAAWALAEALGHTAKPLDIQVTATDGGLDVDVRGSGPLPAKRAGVLARLADSHQLARITRHGEMIIQRTTPTVRPARSCRRPRKARRCWRASSPSMREKPGPSRICSAVSGRSRCGSPSGPASSRPTAMPVRSRRYVTRSRRRPG
jgi:23S rRNA (uracil1939-C5)-methyltransferase